MPKCLFCAVALWAFVTPASARAQPSSTAGATNAIDDIRKNYRIHAGPFYVNPAILLKELGVDSNVFNAAGEQKSDFTFTITPQAGVAVPFARRGLLTATLGTDVVYYAKYGSERSVDPQAAVRAEAYAHRVTLFAEGSVLNTRQRPNHEIDLRSRRRQNDIAAGVNVRLTPRFSAEVSGGRGRARFDADAFFLGSSLQQTLNRDSRDVGVTARHRLTSLTTIAARYERQLDRFPLSPVRDTHSYRVMPGVEFKPRALINGVAYVGYRSFTPISSTLPRYAGLVSQVGLFYTLLGSTMFGVTADRDVAFSFEELTPYFVDNSVGMSVRRAVGGRWDVRVNAARHNYAYRNLTLATPLAPVPARTDTTDTFGANIGYRIGRHTRAGFGASYSTRSSNVAAYRDYNVLRIGTTVTYGS